jgi:hypothetical protein
VDFDIATVEFSNFGVIINFVNYSTTIEYKYESTSKWTFECGRLIALRISFSELPIGV